MASIQSAAVIVATSEADLLKCKAFLDSMGYMVGQNTKTAAARSDDGLTITITFAMEDPWGFPDPRVGG